jgi:GT2 family glycosyltransferase
MVPVIIPYYQKSEQLHKCLAHLQAQTIPVVVFVRDNNQENVYFTAAINEGLRNFLDNVLVKYLIILNQDMYLATNAVEEMVKFMEGHPACGIGTPLQLHSEVPNYVICAGGLEAFPVGKHIQGPLSSFPEDFEILWGNGACMMFRKKMVQEIGLLDKNLVFIGSDSDYCFTARSRGWQVWTIVKARGVHEVGQSQTTSNLSLEKLKLQDMIFWEEKWLSGNLYRKLANVGWLKRGGW